MAMGMPSLTLHLHPSPKLSKLKPPAFKSRSTFLPPLPTPTYNFAFSNHTSLPPTLAALQTASSTGVLAVQADSNSQQVLVETLLSLVRGTDRGSLLKNEEHAKVLDVVSKLEQFCMPEPLQCPLIFGDWDVEYCSNPTAPGGYYRSAIGRVFLKTEEMAQTIVVPDKVQNRVAFAVFGVVAGEVSLKGNLEALDNKWIRITFDPPNLKLGSLKFVYGGPSIVKIAITYLDEWIRLGRGSRGSVFVFKRRM